MWVQAVLFAAQMWLGEVTKQRPHKVTFEEFQESNGPSEVRPIPYIAGTEEIIPSRIWYGDFTQRAVERDSHWTDYLWAGGLAFLLDTITVAYRYYVGETFALCFGPDAHVEAIKINDRLVFQATVPTDNAGGGFLIDDPQAWGGDQPPGEGGEYAWCDLTRGNYTDPTNAYLESLLTTAPNKTPAGRGITLLVKRGPSGFTESGYFAAGGIGFQPKLKEWKVTVRRQPNNLATAYSKIGRHANPMEVIYEHCMSLEFGAKCPVDELNISSFQSVAQTLHGEGLGWSGKITNPTSPLEVINNVLSQIDGVLDPSPSLGLTARLIRRDYTFASVPVMDHDVIESVDRFTPGTYEDTVNKVIVPFGDQGNNFAERPGLYIDPANVTIQGGRVVPQTQEYLGVADYTTANLLATRDGRALSVPRAVFQGSVKRSWGKERYRGEVFRLDWSNPSFSLLMRVTSLTPGNSNDPAYRIEAIEDQFATGLRTFGEPSATLHDDPGTGLDTAPPSATWNTTDFPPDGLIQSLVLTNTNQFIATITGGIIFGSYTPGGQYARVWVTEPSGVQTLSPIVLAPDANNEDTFTWPANAAGVYEFCIQTFSLHDATNEEKICAEITIAVIGSPSVSPSVSASISPSSSVSPSVSPSSSVSPSVSPSASVSPSSSASPSESGSASASISPSSSISPSPSGAPAAGNIVYMSAADHESGTSHKWPVVGASSLSSGITDAHGIVYRTTTSQVFMDLPTSYQTLSARMRIRPTSMPGSDLVIIFRDITNTNQVALRLLGGDGSFSVVRATSTTIAGPSATGLWTADNWYTVELKAHIHDTAGSVEASMYNDAGTLLATISATGIDSQNTVNASASRIGMGGISCDPYFDNVSVDSTGEIHGVCRVETLLPTGAGDLAAHTRGGADSGANWSQCEENPDNADTDYVQSTGADQDDCYVFADRSLAGENRAVQVVAIAKLAGGASRQIKLFVRIGGVTYLGSETHTLTSSYRGYWECWTNNPATGNAWGDTEINNAQFGVRSLTTDCRITQLAVEVLVGL